MHNAHGHVRDVRGRAMLSGDGMTLSFAATGAFACEASKLALELEAHEGYALELDVGAGVGEIRSIDDRFVIGP